jgi:TPR repeat protein
MPIALRFPIALVLSIVCLTTPAWADFQAGMDAYDRKDYATALREWQPLAEQGNAHAQNYLGVLCDKGHGVPQDYVQAHKWYNLAAANGNKDAATLRDELAILMTPAQIYEAQKLAREWKPIKSKEEGPSNLLEWFQGASR